MSAPLRTRKSNKSVAFFILGLLVLSLLGFGVRSVGRTGNQTIAMVGSQEVTVDQFYRELNGQVRALSRQIGQNVTIEQARTLGIEEPVLAQVLAAAALDGENARIGLSVGDRRIRELLLNTPAFQDVTGAFDETAYKYQLEQQGLKPAENDDILRRNSARVLLQTAISGGIAPTDSYGRALLTFVGEQRTFRWAAMNEGMLAAPVAEPGEADIAAWYTDHPDAYTAPRIRKITYAALLPEMIVGSIKPPETDLRALYDGQPERFNTAQRRVIDRVVFGNQAEAEAAFAALQSGEKTFADVVGARGLELADVDMGEVVKGTLGGAGDAVFALSQPGLAGPVATDLGPAIFRVKAILAAKSQPFDAVRDMLGDEYAADAARRRIDADITAIDDLLASGATLEEVAAETDMQVAVIDFAEGNTGGIAANEEFRTAALAATKDDFPEVKTLAGGGIFALRLDAIIEPELKPLADVRSEVIADWKHAETIRTLREYADANKTRLENGDSFASLALIALSATDLRRESPIDGAPQGLVGAMFKLKVGEVAVFQEGDAIVIARLDAIRPFDANDPQNAALMQSARQQFGNLIGRDIARAFGTALQDREGITVNQALVNAVFTQSATRAPRHQ